MKLKITLLAILSSSIFFSQGIVDGFFKGKSNLDLALSYTYQKSEEYWAGKNLITIPRNLHIVGVFAEMGVTDKFDVIVNAPIINGIAQDFSVFLKHKMIDKKIKNSELSIFPALGYSMPMTNYVTQSASAIGQRATQILPKLVLQLKFGNGIFIQTQGGYNYSFSPVSSSVPFSAKIGIAKAKIYADAWFDFQHGVGIKDYTGSTGFPIRDLSVSYQRIGGVFYYSINNKLGTFLNTAYSLNGRNSSKAFFVGTGLVIKFKVKKD